MFLGAKVGICALEKVVSSPQSLSLLKRNGNLRPSFRYQLAPRIEKYLWLRFFDFLNSTNAHKDTVTGRFMCQRG